MRINFVNKFNIFCHTALSVGWFLALRQIKRSSKWTTVLIIFIMTLTFLNLVVVNGILVGLVEGSSRAYRQQYSGDFIIKELENKTFIPDSVQIVEALKNYPEVKAVSPRILIGGRVEANYRNKTNQADLNDQVAAQITGIDYLAEDEVSNLSKLIIKGKYFDGNDEGSILIGTNLLQNYSSGVPGDDTLDNVDVGDKVRIIINGSSKEFIIKGVIKSKINEVGRRVFMTDSQLRKIIARPDLNVNEISVKLNQGIDPLVIKQGLEAKGFQNQALLQTWEDSQGKFFQDISSTFSVLGSVIGFIGLTVASITIFIVIFINAVTRRKFIGILKGIGVCGSAIQISYIFLSLFYATIGSIVGLLLLYLFFKPYLDANPIDFPFSDGILVAPLEGTLLRVGLLLVITILAGFIPSRMIVRKNTLDSILGR